MCVFNGTLDVLWQTEATLFDYPLLPLVQRRISPSMPITDRRQKRTRKGKGGEMQPTEAEQKEYPSKTEWAMEKKEGAKARSCFISARHRLRKVRRLLEQLAIGEHFVGS